MRTMTLTVLLVLAAATTAAAQGRHELEVGAGWMQFNPLDIDDFTSIPSGPTLTVTRVGWREDERRGWAIGVTAVLTPQHVPHTVNTRYHFPLYGSVAYRWRWESDDGSDLIWVRLFCVGGPEGSRRGCERHGKSYLTRRRRGEEGDGGGSLTGGAIPSA